MTIKKLTQVCVCLCFAIGGLIVISTALGQSAVSSALFSLSFFASVSLWILSLFEGFVLTDLLALLTSALSFLSVYVNGISNGADFSFEYLKKLIIFSVTLFFFSAAVKLRLNCFTQGFVKAVLVAAALFLVALLFIDDTKAFSIDGLSSVYLCFGFSNPNLMALFLGCMAPYLFISFLEEEKFLPKLLFLLLSASELVFIFLSGSRTGMLSAAGFLLCVMLSALFRRGGRRWPIFLMVVFTLLPLIFAAGYMALMNNDEISGLLSIFGWEGKSVDSRVKIWAPALSAFFNSPVFGDYFTISEGAGSSQMHNSHVDVLASYGLASLVPFTAFIFALFYRLCERSAARSGSLALCGFAAVILLCCGEAAIFSGGLAVYIFAGAFLFLHEMPDEKKNLSV